MYQSGKNLSIEKRYSNAAGLLSNIKMCYKRNRHKGWLFHWLLSPAWKKLGDRGKL